MTRIPDILVKKISMFSPFFVTVTNDSGHQKNLIIFLPRNPPLFFNFSQNHFSISQKELDFSSSFSSIIYSAFKRGSKMDTRPKKAMKIRGNSCTSWCFPIIGNKNTREHTNQTNTNSPKMTDLKV